MSKSEHNTEDLGQGYVWRIENKYGAGPYNGHGNINILVNAYFKRRLGLQSTKMDSSRPNVLDDPSLSGKFNHTWFCGFRTLAEYKLWFSSYVVRNLLKENGFFLALYMVNKENTVHSVQQSIFKRDNATLVGVYDCMQPFVKSAPSSGNDRSREVLRFRRNYEAAIL